MTVRRLASVLCVCLIASATVVAAQPKKGAVAPAKDKPAVPPAGSGAGSAGSGAGSGEPVQMAEDPPPADMEGTGENPDAPRSGDEPVGVAIAPKRSPRAGYPIEEVLRPLTLPQNMSEVSIAPHAQLSPFASSDALRARYGITRQVQLGLTYVYGGFYANKDFLAGETAGTKFHVGKAVGLDVSVLLQNWIAVKIGVPVYISPLAVSMTLGVPMKFVFTDKFAIGGFDDFISVKLKRFAPSLYQDYLNAQGKDNDQTGTIESRGVINVSIYGLYQQTPKMVLIGRAGLIANDFGSGKANVGDVPTFLRAGFQYSPRKYLDLGASLGFDDMAHPGTFGPAGFLALRI